METNKFFEPLLGLHAPFYITRIQPELSEGSILRYIFMLLWTAIIALLTQKVARRVFTIMRIASGVI